MNPLLFADWRRMNRLFTAAMWGVAAILVCVLCLVLTSSGPRARVGSVPAGTAAVHAATPLASPPSAAVTGTR